MVAPSTHKTQPGSHLETPKTPISIHVGERGFLLVSLIITTFVLIIIMVVTMQLVIQGHSVSLGDRFKLQSQLAADAGVDYSVDQILANTDWTGTTGEVELSNDASAKTTYQATVSTSADGESKTLSVTGRTYMPATSVTAKSTSKVEVGLKGNGASGVEGGISAYIGVGGLNMTGSALVSGGVVFSNGGVVMTGTSQIGSSGTPVDTYAANMTCPLGGGSGYPRLCNSGENNNPINIPSWGTHIYGQVKGNNQTNGASMASPGLVAGTVAASSLPGDHRASVVSDINGSGQTQLGAAASCGGTTTKSWPADLKITGDVSIISSCAVTVTGDVWITGNLTVNGSAKLIVQSGLSIPPHIFVDGSTGFQLQNSGQLVPNASGTGFRVVTFYSADPCSVSASGCVVTGTALYNSINLPTITIDGSTQSTKTQYYARWSKVALNGSADVGALIGQTLSLTGTAEIHSGVEVDPSQPGTLTWSVASYKRVF